MAKLSIVVYVVLGGGAVAAGYKALRSAPLMVNFQLNTPACQTLGNGVIGPVLV